MLKYVLCFAALVIPFDVAAQQQVVTPKGNVPIRVSPPSPLLLGFAGWEVAQTERSERYALLQTLKIRAFSSTQTWAEVELANSNDSPKKGWVYWGESLDDNQNFEVFAENEQPPKSQAPPPENKNTPENKKTLLGTHP